MMKEHSLRKSVFLHLFPGALITFVFIVTAPLFQSMGIPIVFGLLAAIAFILVPFELGVILFASKKEYGTFSLKSALSYTEPVRPWLFVLLIVGLFLWSGIYVLFSTFVDPTIIKLFFSWLPEWFFIMEDYSAYSKEIVIMTIITMFFLNGLIGPIVEELYFRGYLLPRIARLENGAPILNAVLFSVYHFFSPWQNISRILLLIPMCWVVFKKKNIYIGMAVHCLGNIFTTLSLLVYL